ncbi:hypothetical protein [Roseateles sp. P5_E7]
MLRLAFAALLGTLMLSAGAATVSAAPRLRQHERAYPDAATAQ